MSTRPPIRVSTVINSSSSSNNRRSPVYSPLHTQPSPFYSNAPTAMSSRKRPLDPRPRGQSPPDKRSRLPDRSGSFQDRYADPGSPPFPSPPVSRKNSLATLPLNVPTGPAPKTRSGLRIDSYRPGHDREPADHPIPNDHFRGPGPSFPRTDDQGMSPRDIGSEASTPVHTALPVPSMVPIPGASSNASILQGQEPLNIASLQTLRSRRKGIADGFKSKGVSLYTSSSLSPSEMKLHELLAACQAEIKHLQTDREEMAARITKLEDLSTRFDNVATQTDRLKRQHESTNLMAKVEALEQLNIPSRLARFDELVTLPKTMAEVTGSLADFNKTFQHTEKTVTDLETDIASLKTWKQGQERSIAPSITKDEMRKEVHLAVETAVKVSQTKDTHWRNNVTGRLDEVDKSINSVLVGNKSFMTFKASQECINKTATDQFKEISENGRTYAKAQKVEEWITDVENRFRDVRYEIYHYIGPIKKENEDTDQTLVKRLNTLESDQAKLSKDCRQFKSSQEGLNTSVEKLKTSHGKLNTTLEKLNGAQKSPSTTNGPAKDFATTKSLDKVDAQLTRFKKDLEALQSQLKDIDIIPSKQNELAVQINELSKQVSRLDSAVKETNKPLDNVPTSGSGSTALVDSQIAQIRQELKEVGGNIDQLDNGLQSVEKDIHTHANLISVLREDVPNLFREKMGSFQQTVEEQFATTKRVSDELESSITALKNEVADSSAQSIQSSSMQEQQGQLASIVNETNFLKEQVDKLQASFAEETSAREHAIHSIIEQMAAKVGLGDINPQLDALKVAFQSLETRWENITTDQLHQGMVHWFNQNYPNQGNMFGQLNDLRQDVTRLQPLVQQLTWVQQMAPQLQGLSNFATDMQQQIPQIRAKADQASNDAQAAYAGMDESKRHVETIHATLRTQQTALNNLSQVPNLSIRLEAIDNLWKEVAELRTGIAKFNQGLSNEEQARVNLSKEIRSTATAEHDNRVKVETRMKENNDALAKQVATIETSVNELRHDFDTVNQNDIQPHKEFFGLQGMVAVSVAQLQLTVENVNHNVGSRKPLDITWEHDFNHMRAPTSKVRGRRDK